MDDRDCDEPPALRGSWAGRLWRWVCNFHPRALRIARRVTTGVWQDGFIHAGNLAYMGILALFPFFIVVGALFSALGVGQQSAESVHAAMRALPPVVDRVLEPVALGAISARHGWVLWAGGAVGLWTVSSLVETIRDILRRAYGTPAATRQWWRYRLVSTGMILVAVVLLLASLYAQVAITAAQELIRARFHYLLGAIIPLRISRLVPVAVLYGALHLLFLALTPPVFRHRDRPIWPGALLVTTWWAIVSIMLPVLLHGVFTYDLTYGSLAGVMIALFFFWLVGLGMVTGAELNAALAFDGTRDPLGQADNWGRSAMAGADTATGNGQRDGYE